MSPFRLPPESNIPLVNLRRQLISVNIKVVLFKRRGAYCSADMTREFASIMAEHMNKRKGIELPSSRYQFIK